MEGTRRMRSLARGLVILLGATVLVGCGDDEQTDGSATGGSSTSEGSTTATTGGSVAGCTEEGLSAAYVAGTDTTPVGVYNPVCTTAWALAIVVHPVTWTSDAEQLFEAVDGEWVLRGDVVPVDAVTLEDLGVPAEDARILVDGYTALSQAQLEELGTAPTYP